MVRSTASWSRFGSASTESSLRRNLRLAAAPFAFFAARTPRSSSVETLSASAKRTIGRRGLTAIGRALQKHAARGGGFSATTSSAENAKSGAGFLRFLFRNGTVSTAEHARWGRIVRARLPDGRGAQWTAGGDFIGLLEAYTPR